MIVRWGLPAVVAIALSGCTVSQMTSEGAISLPYANCPSLSEKQTAIKWDSVETVDVEYANDSFSNSLLELEVGKPVVLRVTNNGENLNWFRADDFFPTVAVNRVSYDGVGADGTCLDSVGLAPGKTVEVQLIPTQEGVFRFYEGEMNSPFLSELFISSALGYIYVR